MMHLFYNIVFFCSISVCVVSNSLGQHIQTESKSDFGEYFNIHTAFKVQGTSDLPLVTIGSPHISNNYIYFSDSGTDKVYKVNRQGEVVGRFGQQGKGPTDFNRPGDIVSNSKGTIFINDVGNMRLKVYDQNLNLLTINSPTLPNSSNLMIDPKSPDHVWLVGTRYSDNALKLIHRFNHNKGYVSSMVDYEKTPVHIWVSDVSHNGTIYFAHGLSNSIDVYEASGNHLNTIPLVSDHLKLLTIDNQANVPGVASKLRNESFTGLKEIVHSDNYLFVQFEKRNYAEAEHGYILDIYDISGEPIVLNINTNLRLAESTNKGLLFYQFKPEDYGEVLLVKANFNK